MNETFGQRLQRLRKQANLTQEEVATKLNITFQAVSKWENDISAPDISVLNELSDILGVTLDELLGKQPTTQYVPVADRKDIGKMFLHIKANSSDGDKVNVNLPLAVVKVFLDSGANIPVSTGNINLANIDFKQIYSLVENGVVGKLIDVESADGDHVEIWVE